MIRMRLGEGVEQVGAGLPSGHVHHGRGPHLFSGPRRAWAGAGVPCGPRRGIQSIIDRRVTSQGRPPPGQGVTPTGLAAGAVGLAGYGVSPACLVLALRHLGTVRTGAYLSLAPFAGAALSLSVFREGLSIAGSSPVTGTFE